MQRADSLEKTLMLGKTEGQRRRGRQRMRWLDGVTNSMDVNSSKLQEIVEDKGAGKESDTTQLLNNSSSSNPLTWRLPRCKMEWRRLRHLSADFPVLLCVLQSLKECPSTQGPGVSRRVLDTKAHFCLGHAENI